MKTRAANRKNIDLIIPATENQAAAAKHRLNTTADKVPGFRDLFPSFQETVDALPDLQPLQIMVQEMRPVFLDALVDEGVAIPREVWEYFNCEWLYRGPDERG